MSGGKLISNVELEVLQRQSFSCFRNETNPENGLAIDKAAAGWPAGVAAKTTVRAYYGS